MKPRPIAVWVFPILFILAGLVGIIYHFSDRPLDPWILLLRLLAIVGGIFLFLGHNWARWLLAAWLAFHVAVSAFHSIGQTAAHLVLLVLVVYFLWRPEVSSFLRRASSPG